MNNAVRHADAILLARRCHTLARAPRPVEALAIAGGRIIHAGRRRDVLRLRGRRTRLIDLGAAVLTPGLVDCHTHFVYWALQRALIIDLAALRSLDSVLRCIRAQARRRRVGEWVLAAGFDANRWGSTLPTAADLDRVVPDHPALVRSRDGHTAWLNTRGLARAGITAATPDPPGGRYLRDAAGRPTGIVQEAAVDALPNPLRELAQRQDAEARRCVDRALDAAYHVAWAHGFVGVHVMDDGPSLSQLLRHHGAGRLGLRIVHAIALADLDHAAALGLRSGLGDDRLRLGGVKIFADGSLGSQTAWMYDPYPGRGDFRGVPVVAGAALREAVGRAAGLGWAVWIHAIGDRAVADALDALAAARRLPAPPLPNRIEHAQCVRPADVRRMAQLGVVASVQPCHLLGDIATADRHWPRARRNAYPFRALLEAGVTLAAGTDVPVEPLDARPGLRAAALRVDERGEPAGGWFPRQRLTVRQSLRAFTRGAAEAVGLPGPAGTLARGAPADVAIWAEDPLAVRPEELPGVGIRGCVVGGEVHLMD